MVQEQAYLIDIDDDLDIGADIDDTELAAAFGLEALPPPQPPRRPPPPIEEVLAEMVDIIVEHVHPLKIILFGSRARGTHRPHSDVDLLVVLPEVTNDREAAVAIGSLLAYMPVAKDVFVTTPQQIEEERDIVTSILYWATRQGKVLYDDTSAA